MLDQPKCIFNLNKSGCNSIQIQNTKKDFFVWSGEVFIFLEKLIVREESIKKIWNGNLKMVTSIFTDFIQVLNITQHYWSEVGKCIKASFMGADCVGSLWWWVLLLSVSGLQCYGCNVFHGQRYVDVGCSNPEVITCTLSHKDFKHRFCIKTESSESPSPSQEHLWACFQIHRVFVWMTQHWPTHPKITHI